MTLRWHSGFLASGPVAVSELWTVCGDRRTLMVVGAGFDPRAPVAYERIAAAASTPVDVVRIPLDALPTDLVTSELAAASTQRLDHAVHASEASFLAWGPNDGPASSPGMVVARAFFDAGFVADYDQVVIDVSALPRGVFFPLVRGMLLLHDDDRWRGDLHVVACDNPPLDALVAGDGVEAPTALPGFVDRARVRDADTRIWVPVLGERESARVDALYQDIRAQEICPVLPFPATNPRRSDDLIKEYRELLFDRIEVEPRNFIWAAESNPLDLYRTLSGLNQRYAEAFTPLGDTRMILSAHSSKLLSIGVLLTAYEHGLEVRHAGASFYTVDDPSGLAGVLGGDHVADLWLTGEPYA